ncbi:choline BCCT transporter BetT [Moraxella equi]|uniref:Glycine betaine transporter BetP n=1 Tax=Moraxella equi TaxID=60442 RepID=A0A378QQL6_9GAMM|nr:choline BCCT transporter BetT [Moraxella equi]OPH39200.1 high-affinity choline transporter BetT [Moraxella equi]STZ02584.1 Glycine betaine transporter BetP [Moraxella equi]
MEDTKPEDGRLNRTVFACSAVIIVFFSLYTMLFNDSASAILDGVLAWVSTTFGWYYFFAASVYIIFVLFIACSRYGNIKLGPKHSQPEYSLLTWSSMLFAAGIGIDIMFFSVAEPIMQYMNPPVGDGQTTQAAREALMWTIFHYGLTGWCMYALVGIALGYSAYRYNLPLTIRSALYPMIGKKIDGAAGHAVDVAAILGTIFGIATTCGIGVVQLNYGLHVIFDLPENMLWQIGLIALAVAITIVSATTGASKGIKILSELNIYFALGLILFVLFLGNTEFLLNAIVMNVGDYLSRFPTLTLDTFAYNQTPGQKQWIQDWTLFFWAWWIAWSPFVGLFLAQISKGRTIREFVIGTLSIPFMFTLAWLSVMGNSALNEVLGGNLAFAEKIIARPEIGFYELLSTYPWFSVTAIIAFVSGLLFYVTSADSGAIVLSNFSFKSQKNTDTPPIWIRLFWAVTIGMLTAAMLMTDGITALQKATIVMGLPFSFVMFFVMVGLFKSLRLEDFREEITKINAVPVAGGVDVSDWQTRLHRITAYPDAPATKAMMTNVCLPALTDVADALRQKGLSVRVESVALDGEPSLVQHMLTVDYKDEYNFVYGIVPVKYPVPERPTVDDGQEFYYRLETYLFEGLQGNDLSGFNSEQVINDVLDKYERHRAFLHLNRETPGSRPVFPK